MTDTHTAPPIAYARASTSGVQNTPLAPKLFVPLPAVAQRATDHVAVGTRVARGDALLTSLAGASFIPLAPAVGKVVVAKQVQLLSGKNATALEIEVEDARSDVAAFATPQAAPVEQTEFIERLRRAGVAADRHG